jgi:hypothetical protein
MGMLHGEGIESRQAAIGPSPAYQESRSIPTTMVGLMEMLARSVEQDEREGGQLEI